MLSERKSLLRRRVMPIVFWVVVVALGLNWVHFRRQRSSVFAAPQSTAPSATPVPYTVVLQQNAQDTNGKTTLSSVYTYAVRGDGSTVLKSESEHNELRILEFASLAHVEIKDVKQLRSSRSSQRLPYLRNPTASCTIGRETVQGIETIGKFRAAKVIGPGGSRTSWFGVDNGCALLQEDWRFSTGDTTRKTLTSLAMGEPDPVLFQVPESYREVPPSVLAGKDPNNPPFIELDAFYDTHRLSVLPK